jgi:hypothetical protein
LHHLQFSLQKASPETFGYILQTKKNELVIFLIGLKSVL